MKMALRLAQAREIPIIATIYAAAFWNEHVMGRLMHPYRGDYPDDYLRYWMQRVTEWYWDYSHQLVVTYNSNPSAVRESQATITGVADWIRYGDNWENIWGIRGRWDPRRSITRMIATRNRVLSYVYPNRAADPEMSNMASVITPIIAHFWSGSRRTGWYLNFLAVDPAYQNQRYGSSLVEWGVQRAKKENVVASVISGEGRDDFYKRCGLNIVVGNSTEGEGNPLKGKTDGGTILFYDPKA